jgi:hypothetical protein
MMWSVLKAVNVSPFENVVDDSPVTKSIFNKNLHFLFDFVPFSDLYYIV